jgi:hypothetical protein
VLTERGFVLVSETGVRYSVTSAEDLQVLGLVDGESDGEPETVAFRVLEGLPDGGVLTEERASRTVSSTGTPGW